MKTEDIGFRINEGCGKVERVRGGDEGETGHTRSRFNVYTHRAAAEQERSRTGKSEKKKKKHKEKTLNSYLPTLKEVESCTDVGDPVDPL